MTYEFQFAVDGTHGSGFSKYATGSVRQAIGFSPDELAVELGMTPEKVAEAQKYGRELEPPAADEDPGPAPS